MLLRFLLLLAKSMIKNLFIFWLIFVSVSSPVLQVGQVVRQVDALLESGGKDLTSFAFYPVPVLAPMATRAACQACK